MPYIHWAFIAALLLAPPSKASGTASCDGGASPLDAAAPAPAPVADLLAKIAARESASASARLTYSYTEDVAVQTLRGKVVDGEFRRVTAVSVDRAGGRHEETLPASYDRMSRATVTPADLDYIRDHTGFYLTPETLARESARYLGRQRIDEIDAFVFAVSPKEKKAGVHSFEGRVWVDDRDLAVMKTCGRSVTSPRAKDGSLSDWSPLFVTYREQIGGADWFPTYARAEEDLRSGSGTIRVREIVKFIGYKRGPSDAK